MCVYIYICIYIYMLGGSQDPPSALLQRFVHNHVLYRSCDHHLTSSQIQRGPCQSRACAIHIEFLLKS